MWCLGVQDHAIGRVAVPTQAHLSLHKPGTLQKANSAGVKKKRKEQKQPETKQEASAVAANESEKKRTRAEGGRKRRKKHKSWKAKNVHVTGCLLLWCLLNGYNSQSNRS